MEAHGQGGAGESPNGSPQETAGAPSPETLERPDAYVIPMPLAQATLDYLAMRPYREVYQLVRAFESLEPLTEVQEDQPPPSGHR
jgi:hypothetical protein